MKQPELILFAMQPVPGGIKSLLCAGDAAPRAAELAAALVRATVDRATANWPGEVYVYGAPDTESSLLVDLKTQFHVQLGTSKPGDPTACAHAALTDAIARGGAAALMGCDVPHCRPDAIEQAHELLARGRNVIGPTDRGGFYLIGLQQAPWELFADVGTGPQAYARTIARAQTLGMEFEQLPVLRELESVMDLWLVGRDIAALRGFV